MGLAYAQLTLENPRDPRLASRAGARPGGLRLRLPYRAAARRHPAQSGRDCPQGSVHRRRQLAFLRYVGPVRVRCDNRDCFTGAIVLGDEVLLGAIPMEDMDLVILAQEQRVVANPRNPNFAAALAKGVRTRKKA